MSTGPSTITLPTFGNRAWYHAPLSRFINASVTDVIGHLAENNDFDLTSNQRNAWISQIEFLQKSLRGLVGTLLLEFNIPRMGRRIDAVILIGPAIFVVEFKTGESEFEQSAIDQVWDYALDLKNFHRASHDAPLIPIIVVPDAEISSAIHFEVDHDKVYRPSLADFSNFRNVIDLALRQVSGAVLDNQQWADASYHPTPTIIEAARSLYAQHSVQAINTFDAGKRNLRVTSRRIEELVDEAQKLKRKIICFVTGVPGAGKTLVGLNVATRRRGNDEPTHAVFLSGNGPLVAVLREALARDEIVRRKAKGERPRKADVAKGIKAFIQNVHNFRDEALIDKDAPIDRVVIFDEAQRAWNHRQTASFMRRKKNHANFAHSEPEFLVSYMDRHQDWAVVVCLVGGGQEINIGEAGIEAWIEAINTSFPEWHMYISSNLTDSEYGADKILEIIRQRNNTHWDEKLHLAVSERSFRAENVSAFVKALLDCETDEARKEFQKLANRYPIVLTRDLKIAKHWVRAKARGTERFGLIASSRAQRLKPHAIDVRFNIDPIHWFLNGKNDTRSSYYLEDAATEFQVQGLELDWSCVTWDGDFRFSDGKWTHHDFRGDKWTNINNPFNQNYLCNAYRVLLTRARQGMVIFVPQGDSEDETRNARFYDPTFDYLISLGIPLI